MKMIDMMYLIKYGLLLLMCSFKAAMSLEPQQQHTTSLTCFHSTHPKAPAATKLFPEDEDNGSLWQRDQDVSLPRCSASTFHSLSSSKCIACLDDQELFVICSNLSHKVKVVLESPESEISIKETDCAKRPFIETPKPPDRIHSDNSSFVTKNDTTPRSESNSRERIAFYIPLSILILILIIIIIIIIRVVCVPQQPESQTVV